MPIAFVVEDGTGKADATSYVTVEEADDINALNIHNNTAWAALTLTQKQNLLIYSSKAVDARTRWKGERTKLTQGLEWPRAGVKDAHGNNLSNAAVPFNVRMAVVEFAKWNATTDRIAVDRPDSVLQEVKVDTITVKFADASANALSQYELPEIVVDLLRGYGSIRERQPGVAFGKVVRGA